MRKMVSLLLFVLSIFSVSVFAGEKVESQAEKQIIVASSTCEDNCEVKLRICKSDCKYDTKHFRVWCFDTCHETYDRCLDRCNRE